MKTLTTYRRPGSAKVCYRTDQRTDDTISVSLFTSLLSHLSLSVQQHTGFLQSHAVNEECVKHTSFIIQTKQVHSEASKCRHCHLMLLNIRLLGDTFCHTSHHFNKIQCLLNAKT